MAAAKLVSLDTLITIKVQIAGENRRFKLPLSDLGVATFDRKLRELLAIPEGKVAIFERYSDSAGKYVVLDGSNVAVYKQLHRAAKAKLKIRIKATVLADANDVKTQPDAPKEATNETLPPPPSVPEASKPATLAPPPAPPKPIELVKAQREAHMKAIKESLEAQSKLQNAHVQYLADQKARQTFAPAMPSWPSQQDVLKKMMNHQVSSTTLQDYNMQLMLLEQQNKKRHILQKVEEERRAAAQKESASTTQPQVGGPTAQFSVCCNICQDDIPDAHWHCSICVEGDYDLCPKCMEAGHHCHVDNHFLVKRIIENGKVINSTVQTFPMKRNRTVEVKTEAKPVMVEEIQEQQPKEIPGAYTEAKEAPAPEELSRTCNACVNVFEESKFVTCLQCDDYDLCLSCHVEHAHGHHPGHTFTPVSESLQLTAKAKTLLAAGRDVRHAAICDGCDKTVVGVRHKCLDCPDFDYCTTCSQSARVIHPGHRFIPIYDPIALPLSAKTIHFGIRCDGNLCKDNSKQSFIVGDRYKCAVCYDVDFCASCEALPTNSHNRTHPLIKFHTPVRNCSVTTYNEQHGGATPVILGDQIPQTSSKSTETTPAAPSANAATQVQTVAETKPTETSKKAKAETSEPSTPSYQALFVRDTVTDGTTMGPNNVFEQVWTLRNPGPHDWPAGCSLRFTGGDRMLNIEASQPLSSSDLDKALSSSPVPHPVKAGAEVDVRVTLRAPGRNGNAISYWRMKSPEGTPFGHRLWCDIMVNSVSEVVETKSVEASTPKQEPRESQMIFPTLERESPLSSMHDSFSRTQNPAPASSISPEDQEFLEDVESLELEDDDSTDDGFLTDEEYDVLDDESEYSAATNGRA